MTAATRQELSPGSRHIIAAGQDFSLRGRAGDSYFENVTPESLGFFSNALQHLPPDATIIDVGANIGIATIVSKAALPQATVYCFEPDAEAYGHLLVNIESNRLTKTRAMQAALSDRMGQLCFFHNQVSASFSHVSIGAGNWPGEEHHVTAMTLDAFVEDARLQRLDLIKIDVEGFEIDVLSGAAQAIAASKPIVFVEFNSFTMVAFRNINPRKLLDHLLATFPFVYAEIENQKIRIDDLASQVDFLHSNLRNGCVNDLLCSWSAI